MTWPTVDSINSDQLDALCDAIDDIQKIANRLILKGTTAEQTAGGQILAVLTAARQAVGQAPPAPVSLAVTVLPGPLRVTACESGRHVHHAGQTCTEVDEARAAVTAQLDAALQRLDTAPCPGFPNSCPNLVEVQARSPWLGGGIRCGCREAP